ncbi:hypothetical protein LTR86_010583 [Recurvomyces mirabilis]|nr:hypothetical protein LTR86_010583 [Recurvomyces mirabilis]
MPVSPHTFNAGLTVPSGEVEAAAAKGKDLLEDLQSYSTSNLNAFPWLGDDKKHNGGWKDFNDIARRGWYAAQRLSPQTPRSDSFESLRLPPALEDSVTALTSGKFGRWVDVDWQLSAQKDVHTQGEYRAAYNVENGLIVSMVQEAPMVRQAQGRWQLEDVGAEITGVTYNTIRKNRAATTGPIPDVKEILVVLHAPSTTMSFVDFVHPFEKWDQLSKFTNGILLTPTQGMYRFDLLPGSQEGQAIAKMLLDYRAELGHRIVSSIRVWVPTEGRPCLLFTITGQSTQSADPGAVKRESNTVTNSHVLDSHVTSSASATLYKIRSGTITFLQALLLAIIILTQLSAALPVDSDVTALSLNDPLNALDIAEHKGSQLLNDLQSSFVNPPPETEDARELLDDWTCYHSIRDHGFRVKGETDYTIAQICKDLASPTAFEPYLRELMTALTADQSAPWHFVTWHIEAKEHLQTKGEYSTVYNPRAGIIITITKEDPSVRYPHDVEKQENHWPSITYLTQDMLSSGTVAITPQHFRTSVKQIVMADVKAPTTSLFADLHPRSTWNRLSRYADALVYTPERDPKEFKALLGSAEGLSVALMLLERRAELGHLTVSEVKVFVHNNQPILIFSVAARPALNAASGVGKRDLDTDFDMKPTAAHSSNASLRYRRGSDKVDTSTVVTESDYRIAAMYGELLQSMMEDPNGGVPSPWTSDTALEKNDWHAEEGKELVSISGLSQPSLAIVQAMGLEEAGKVWTQTTWRWGKRVNDHSVTPRLLFQENIYAPSLGMIIKVGGTLGSSSLLASEQDGAKTLGAWPDISFLAWIRLCKQYNQRSDGIKYVLFPKQLGPDTLGLLNAARRPLSVKKWPVY